MLRNKGGIMLEEAADKSDPQLFVLAKIHKKIYYILKY